MTALEQYPRQEIVTFSGGSGGAAMVHLADLMPHSHLTMGVSTGDGGKCTNDVRELYGGAAVGDLRKVLGCASTNDAGRLFHTRFSSEDTVFSVEELNKQFLGAIATRSSKEEADLAAEVADEALLVADKAKGYREYGLQEHTYGNFILTALRLHYDDNLTAAAITANGWLKTRATVIPVTNDAHNLVVYDEAANVIAYGEGAADVYRITDPTRIQVWLEKGETCNFIENDPRKVRGLLEKAVIAERPQATSEIIAATMWSQWAVTGIGSPVTSLYPAVLPEGIAGALSDQRVSGGEWVAAVNPESEATTPGLGHMTYLGWLETAVNRPFDRIIAGIKLKDAHAAGRVACELQAATV